MRLIDHLRGLGMSNRDAKTALATGKVYVGDAPTADAVREVEPDEVDVRANAPRVRPWREPVVVFRDPHLAVLAKPAGMLAVPAASKRGAGSVLSYARRTLGAALPVHRLDEGTSGLMMVARTDTCQVQLKQLLAAHDIERRYLALVAGEFTGTAFRHETLLVRDRGDGKRGSANAAEEPDDGKLAVSHLRRLRGAGAGRTLVEVSLETGRTHQVRIHLSELGFPILGDRLYANRVQARAAPRLALHACLLGFRHPVTGQAMRFKAPLADDLQQLLRASGQPSGSTKHRGR